MEINRALDRLGVGAFIPRTLAVHVAAGCVRLDREPETAVPSLSPSVRSTCRSSGPPCSRVEKRLLGGAAVAAAVVHQCINLYGGAQRIRCEALADAPL
jgi:hypothetical protein